MAKEVNINQNIKSIWNPKEKGEKVIGFYVDKTKFQKSEYNNIVYLIGNMNGDVVAVNDYAVIRSVMQKLDLGMFVSIVYQGYENGKNNSYKKFKIRAWEPEDDSDIERMKKNVHIPGVDPDGEAPESNADDKEDAPF